MENYLKEMLVTLAHSFDGTEKGALVFSLADFKNPLRHLDIFLSPSLSFERLSKGATWLDIGDAKVRVASKELLIQIKERA